MPEPHQALRKGLLADSDGNGFVLLEVLLAMSLIVGVWMALVGTYQNLALRNAQEESKRAQLKKEFDAFEIGEHLRANTAAAAASSKGLSHESSRVSSRNRAIPVTSKSTSQKQR
jgi:Tfp pilus assembly protein PilV